MKRRNGNTDKQFCKRGHEFTPENTYRSGGQRRCKSCFNAYMKARYALHTVGIVTKFLSNEGLQ
jgi:hypothetical protein